MKTRIPFALLLIVLYGFSCFGQTVTTTFDQYKLDGIGSILIPSIMELQAGTYKQLSDKISTDVMKQKGIEIAGDNIVFQQKGLNEFRKVNTYARVIIQTTAGKAGDYRKITTKIGLTPKQLKILDAESKTAIEDSFIGTGLKLLRWDGVSIDKVNGRSVLKTAYLRQLDNNPSVYVEMYTVDNHDREYLLIISYRVADAAIWKDALQTTKNSFQVTNIR